MGKKEMNIVIDSKSGYCVGVTSAIKKAETALGSTNQLYCLGDIVHNESEIQRLSSLGLVTVNHDEMDKMHDTTILFRAHGEPPSSYALAKKNHLTIIDASCPVVLALQKRVKQAYADRPDAQIVIYGKVGHAEVNGLVGQTNGTAIVIEHPDEIGAIDMNKDIMLFSQTTKSIDSFNHLIENIEKSRNKSCLFEYKDTICRQVSNRIPHLKEFAAEYDVILLVSGTQSSNGKVLFNECKNVNNSTYLVSNVHQIKPEWFFNASSVGICGATSTPQWFMEEVANYISKM